MHWLQNDKHEWTNTEMIFEIITAGDKTILHFTHEGLIPEKECYSICEKGWSMIIKDWLFHFITQGTQSAEMTKAAEIRNQTLTDNAKINRAKKNLVARLLQTLVPAKQSKESAK